MRRKPSDSDVVGRYLDRRQPAREFARLAAFHSRLGIPRIGPTWWRDVGRAALWEKNSRIYRVYERGDEVVGFLGIVPLHLESAAAMLEGKLSPWWDLKPEHVHSPQEERRARTFGCAVFLDAFLRVDSEADHQMRGDLTHETQGANLKLMLAHSSTEESESALRNIGMVQVLEGEEVPTGRRRLWKAEPADVFHDDPMNAAGHPYLWYIFDRVRARYTPPAGKSLLTRQQQIVAYLFYLEARSEDEIAAELHIEKETVRTHLDAVRGRIGKQVAVDSPGRPRKATALTRYLHDHPWILIAAES